MLHNIQAAVQGSWATTFDTMVEAARRLVDKVGDNPEYERAQVELIRDTVQWVRPFEFDDLMAYIFKPSCEFYLDGYPGPVLRAQDSGQGWNGWAIPLATPKEMADYVVQVLAMSDDRDAQVDFVTQALEMYGGVDKDTRVMPCGWTWSKKEEEE